jgi:hypothetical protein
MVLTELVSNPVQHVSTILPGLFTDAEDFLENIDITYLELTGEGTELSPRVVPWIANNLSTPAYEIKAKVEEWLECHSNESLWNIPVARYQMFRLPNGHYFLIAGIIPTGEISGRYFYHTRKRGRTYGPDGTLFLKPDWRPSFSSQQRGSGWNTLLPPDGLVAAHRVLVIRSRGQAEVVYEQTRVSGLPVHPSPAGPTEPITPPVIAEAADLAWGRMTFLAKYPGMKEEVLTVRRAKCTRT